MALWNVGNHTRSVASQRARILNTSAVLKTQDSHLRNYMETYWQTRFWVHICLLTYFMSGRLIEYTKHVWTQCSLYESWINTLLQDSIFPISAHKKFHHNVYIFPSSFPSPLASMRIYCILCYLVCLKHHSVCFIPKYLTSNTTSGRFITCLFIAVSSHFPFHNFTPSIIVFYR